MSDFQGVDDNTNSFCTVDDAFCATPELAASPMIGIVGPIGAGKSYVADYMKEAWGFEHVSFAHRLKTVVSDLFGLPFPAVFGTQEDKNIPIEHLGSIPPEAAVVPGWDERVGTPWTGRAVLEWFGTEGCRMIDPNVWTNYVMRDFDSERVASERGARLAPPRVVVGDVRFPNEAAAIRARGGILIGVSVIGEEPAERTGHASDGFEDRCTPECRLGARRGATDALKASTDSLLETLGIARVEQ